MKKILLLVGMALALTACQPESQPQTKQPNSSEKDSTLASLLPENIANYAEKYDIAQFVLVAQKTGLAQGEQKASEWNTRLIGAKNNADAQAVFREQLAFYQDIETQLGALEMKSEQGKAMKAKILHGVAGIRGLLEQLQQVDLSKPEGLVIANETVAKFKPFAHDVAQGMQLFMDMMKNNGLNFDATNEAQIQEKLQQMKDLLK
ncbi:hypothetical protein ACKLNO_02135 [Neisseriaceae bacterium B1]